MADDEELPPGAADLYELDPSEFVAARDALARSLKSEGERDAAARVSALRRPPRTAWGLNQVARHQPELVVAVRDSVAAVQRAFEGDGDVRAAQHAHLSAVADAVDAAMAAGVEGDAMRTRVRNTVLAAGADPELAEEWERGVLSADHDAPGFVLPGAPPPRRDRSSGSSGGSGRPGIRRVGGRRRRAASGATNAAAATDAAADDDAARAQAEADAAAAAAAAEAEERQRAQEQRARLRARRELDRRIERLEAAATRTAAAAEEQQRRADEARAAAESAEHELADARAARRALDD